MKIVECTGSTNADLLGDPKAVEGDWLVTLAQESGKGRQGRSWTSEAGNFAGSTLVELRDSDPPAQLLSLIAGLALLEAIDMAIPAQPLMLKWPNDVLLLGRKLAGILLERTGTRVVVGFGVNLAVAPVLADRQCAALGAQIGPQELAHLLEPTFARLLSLWRQSEPSLLVQAWLARAHPIGTHLTVHSSGEATVTGRFDGLEPDGALRLRHEDGKLELVRAGDVEL